MKRLLLILWLVASVAPAQGHLRPEVPESVGMSGAILEAGASLFEDAVQRDELRGAVVLVARRGRVALHEAYGWRDERKSVPMGKDSLFHMASNTKPVVATAILQLVEAGKLGLDDEVREHIPTFDHGDAARITVRQLLNHTSGFRINSLFLKPLMKPSAEHPDAPNLRLESARFGEVGPKVTPGTTYSYSNPGYNTLGALVEIASGRSLTEYLKQRIYAPLGMVDSCNHEPLADPKRMSALFRRKGKGWRISWRPGGPPKVPFPRASGGMISTAADYAVFCQMFLDGGVRGETRLLSEAHVREATTPQNRAVFSESEREDPDHRFYGLGWAVRGRIFSHGGSDGTFAWVDPERAIVGLVFTQSTGSVNLRAQFMRAVAAACKDDR